jgi:hypothetical protein
MSTRSIIPPFFGTMSESEISHLPSLRQAQSWAFIIYGRYLHYIVINYFDG